jgi:hypothetical protein
MLADSRGNSADVEAMHFADRLADSVQLLNDESAPLHVELPELGVETGGSEVVTACRETINDLESTADRAMVGGRGHGHCAAVRVTAPRP